MKKMTWKQAAGQLQTESCL